MSRFHAYLHTGSQAWYGSLLLTMSRIQVVTDVNHSSPVMFIAYSPMAGKTVQIHIQQASQMSQFECRSTAVATSPSAAKQKSLMKSHDECTSCQSRWSRGIIYRSLTSIHRGVTNVHHSIKNIQLFHVYQTTPNCRLSKFTLIT